MIRAATSATSRAASAAGAMLAIVALAPASASAQRPAAISAAVREYIAVDAPVVALTNALLIDGTGAPPRAGQTVLITGERITWVGPAASARIPAGARVIDLAGKTLMPGMVGLHDHTFYYTNAPRAVQSNYTAPRLYLGSGVTTIRTTGSTAPYAEINLKAGIERGDIPGPRMFVTGPYLISPGPDPRIDALGMHKLAGAEEARRVVDYWASEGATWLKVYTQLSRATAAAVVEQAHLRGLKVTGHICSLGFREAAELGFDAIEHGLINNSEFDPAKQPDLCPGTYRASLEKLDVTGDPRVRATIEAMTSRGVAMTSTLAVYENVVPGRPAPDPRIPDLLSADAMAEEVQRRRDVEAAAAGSTMPTVFRKAMDFEVAFVRAGGLLGAGVDPAWSTPAGLGNQRNYQLLVEAGFTPGEAVQILTLNGARVLGIADRTGSIEVGKQADLAVVSGDPARTPTDIRNVTLVFRAGLGYDAVKLVAAARGLVGIK